jgi:hypothetical protein
MLLAAELVFCIDLGLLIADIIPDHLRVEERLFGVWIVYCHCGVISFLKQSSMPFIKNRGMGQVFANAAPKYPSFQ